MKSIILYYSRSGNTEKVAKQIQQDMDCESIKIVTEIPDLTSYDVIFLGYPVWIQDVPAFVAEFIRRCDVSGKNSDSVRDLWYDRRQLDKKNT